MIFVNFSDPRYAQKCRDALDLIEQIAPKFEMRFKFFYTDETDKQYQKSGIGITWDELPAMGLTTMEHISFAYPQENAWEREPITKWFQDISLKKAQEGDMVVKNYAKK